MLLPHGPERSTTVAASHTTLAGTTTAVLDEHCLVAYRDSKLLGCTEYYQF